MQDLETEINCSIELRLKTKRFISKISRKQGTIRAEERHFENLC